MPVKISFIGIFQIMVIPKRKFKLIFQNNRDKFRNNQGNTYFALISLWQKLILGPFSNESKRVIL